MPSRAAALASSFQDADIDAVLTMLSQHRDPRAFTELPDAEGGRQIQCRFPPADNAQQSQIVATLRLERHHDHPWLRELRLQRLDASGNTLEAHQARFAPQLPAAVTLQTHAPGWLVASLAGSAAVAGRKRQLAPPSALGAPRMRPKVNSPHPASATFPRSHAALPQQAPMSQASAATPLPPRPRSAGMTGTAIRQHQRPTALASIQPAQNTAPVPMRDLHPGEVDKMIQELLGEPGSMVFAPMPDLDSLDLEHMEQRRFYLERQYGHACARHAVNAMVGGPLTSLMDFAQWEAKAASQRGVPEVSMEDNVLFMLDHGVHLDTVKGALQGLGIPVHVVEHRPSENAQGVLVLDEEQARALDRLETDRLLLQTDQYEGDSAISHYVAFRKDAGQWVLLDSLQGVPQHGVAPSAYLLREARIKHFTALWPQQALQGQGASEEIDAMISELRDEPDGSAQGNVPAPLPSAMAAMTRHRHAVAPGGDGGRIEDAVAGTVRADARLPRASSASVAGAGGGCSRACWGLAKTQTATSSAAGIQSPAREGGGVQR